jgi:uncharacterized membrane protein
MASIFEQVTIIVAGFLEALAIVFIAIGGCESAFQALWPWINRRANQAIRREAWLKFAQWILLGLEFTLAADIIRTAIAPTWDSIGQLGAIALLRTFLSYFLERDLEKLNDVRA